MNFDELFKSIALRIKQRRQICMIDAGVSRSGHRRLGAECDAKTCFGQHGEIVRAVADSRGLMMREVETGAQA